MSPAPDLDIFADELYDALAPLTADDEANDYALAHLCAAISLPFELPAEWAEVDEDGVSTGWNSLLDPDLSPDYALAWLGQFHGVRFISGLTEASKRLRVRETDGFKRGSPEALRGAARQYLTGNMTATIRERYNPADPLVDSPYYLQVITYTSETPDPAIVLAALMQQKPAGIILNYVVVDGQDWQSVLDGYTDWNDVNVTFDSWQDVADNIP